MRRLNRRKQIIIDRLQHRLLAFNVLYLVAITVVTLSAVFGPLMLTLWSSASWEDKASAADDFLALHGRVWVPVALAILLVSAHAALVSHRIAGPLYRFREVFKQLARGDLSPRVVLRPRDYLSQEAQSINDMIGGLRDRVSDLLAAVDGVADTTIALERAAESREPHRIPELAREIRKQVEDLETRAQQFLLPSETAASDLPTAVPRPPEVAGVAATDARP